MDIDQTTINNINKNLHLLNVDELSQKELELLKQTSCNKVSYSQDCLAIYLTALALKFRNICNATIIPKLQLISNCASCNINVEDIVNSKSKQLFAGGISISSYGICD